MVALQVRAKGAGNSTLPEFLYQVLPLNALSLLATIPRGSFAVSIPHQTDSGVGYTIHMSLPPYRDGFVLVYVLQPNRRYEAAAALFQNKEYEISDFIAYADQWMEARAGTLRHIPEKYSYFAPSRESWNVIRRDHGYLACDPSNGNACLTSEILQQRQGREASGVIARAPISAGHKHPSQPLSCFERIELTFDLHPNAQSCWIPYEEYLRVQAMQSIPPDIIAINFPEWLKRFAEDCGFESWAFRPGMFFGDRIEWWGDRNRRRSEHEGIDFAEGRQSNGRIAGIPEGTPVRALEDGEVAAVLDDFLGKTIVVRHPRFVNKDGAVLHTQYSHILPDMVSGATVFKNQVLGKVGRLTTSGAPAHFHLAAVWIPQFIPASRLTLGHIHPAYTPVTLINLNCLIEENN
jgi:murein DD-endopeptidase MepM/ murein hydrolase activator NlpD